MAHARSALWAQGHDESVEVNQRALIDKVLARYSGDFTVFRELLQNSDDAGAKAVEIHFHTKAFLDGMDKPSLSEESASQLDGPSTLPDLKTALVHQWTFKNDGLVFRDEDWNRLKKIAEGNPDEDKIGAFGVGFYSLFSVTEEPFVTSGDSWMGFHWKKDQLLARLGKIPTGDSERPDPWTTFSMPLREPVPPPTPFDFIRFLTSSITFMAHLSDVTVWFDGKRLARLSKERGVATPRTLLKGLKPDSSKGLMRVVGVNVMPLHIKAEVMRWVYSSGTSKPRRPTLEKQSPKNTSTALSTGFFSSLFSSFASTPQRAPTPLPKRENEQQSAVEERKKLLQITETNVVLAVYSAEVDVRLDERMRQELLRATKKNAPNKIRVELIYTGKDEYDASKQEDEAGPTSTGTIFQGLRADLDGTGSARVFIGHSTGQTTGLGGHIAARFIPTVERESIDLVDRNVRVWNEELLDVGGYLARTAYELELEDVRCQWEAAAATSHSSPDQKVRASLSGRALHTLKFFTFHPSTPSAQVSTLLEEAFFSCIASHTFAFLGIPPQHSFPIMSTSGVRNISDVRMPNPAFATFLKQLPVLSAEVLSDARPMVDALRSRKMIKEITFQDVLQELRARPLVEEELIACFRWWIGVQKEDTKGEFKHFRMDLLSAAVLATGEPGTEDERMIPLSSIKTFLNTRGAGAVIPTDGPLPSHLLPIGVSRNFDSHSLSSSFPWKELSLVEWLQHLLDPSRSSSGVEHDITQSAAWAERVLNVLTRAWPSTAKTTQDEIVSLLRDKSCVPTSSGLKTPDQAYFQNAHVFPDLPLITLPSGTPIKAGMEKVLIALGVRKHVDLQIVFNRMIKTGDWNIVDLTKYLVAVQATLTPMETERLQMTAAFPQEGKGGELLSEKQKVARHKASDLYEPLDVFRQLGLPIIDWGTRTKWRNSSDEAKFLFRLGLRRFPPLHDLLQLAACEDAAIRPIALKYFLDNFAARYSDYDPGTFANLAFIPALKGNTPCMGKPREVYTAPGWASLGFFSAHPSLNSEALAKLKIKDHPPTSLLVSLLEKSPPDSEDIARQWFGTMASLISEFSTSELKTLSTLLIVPVKRTPIMASHEAKGGSSVRLLAPTQCYFKGESNAQIHSKLFVFVDFGTQANRFLSACGTKHEPSVEEIARILLDNPRQFYELAAGRENFLVELRNLAVNRRSLSSGLITRMKRSPILLGSRRIRKGKESASSELEEDEDWRLEYDLLLPDRIVVADDPNAYQVFGDAIFTAPQEDLLEEFYIELGSRRLSSLIKEEYKTGAETKGSKKAVEIRTLILERLPLFLHEHTHARTRVPYSWLNNDSNFMVKTYGKLTVVKALKFGDVHSVKHQDASAIALRSPRGPIELRLAGNDLIDMYEVSTSMCRLLFDSPKASDALLFMTILSTDLRALKRRGYNVDRILRKQKAERQAAEEAASTALIKQPVPTNHSSPIHADTRSPITPTLSPSRTNNALTDGPLAPVESEDGLDRSQPASKIRSSLDNWRRRFMVNNPPATGAMPETSSTGPPLSHPGLLPPSRPRTPQAGVTPLSNIASNIDLAIRACREEKGRTLRNEEHMQTVKESLNDGYCDVSGRAGDMVHVGEMGDFRMFVTRDVPDPKSIMTAKHDALARFIHVLRPLGAVYGLPHTSLHIFYDVSGELIAFNRNGSLFMNLRFYEAWHDAEVRRGDLSKAFISWYFTLAHEIAHNLVQPHNSEHEFYFSSICERYLPAFGKLLTSGQPIP